MKIAIFGQYRSGTTALLYKIKHSMPDNTLILNEYTNFRDWFWFRNRPLLAKVIAGLQDGKPVANYEKFKRFDKQVYIVRDPRDWLISGILFTIQERSEIYYSNDNLNTVINLLHLKEGNPDSLTIVSLIDKILSCLPDQSVDEFREWLIKHYNWLLDFENIIGEHYTIKYEDFVDDKLEGLEDYLGFTLGGEARVGYKDRHVTRTKGYGDWKNWFTAEDIEFFRPIFRDYMNAYGYDDNWELNHKRIINPEFSSRYVLRTVELRKKRSDLFNKLNNLMGRIWNS